MAHLASGRYLPRAGPPSPAGTPQVNRSDGKQYSTRAAECQVNDGFFFAEYIPVRATALGTGPPRRIAAGGEDTHCPQCGETVIRRYGFYIEEMALREGRCAHCGAAIAGVGL